ncbi:MAG: response regulator [Pseudomonadota bacterium]
MSISAHKIGFVDDEAAVLAGIRRGLGRLRKNWDVAYFTNPKEALQTCLHTHFDVLVTDMRMPEMSGLELVKAVRERCDTPCLILTGSPDLQSALYALNETDVFRYYTKPCDIDLLAGGIEAAIAAADDSATQNTSSNDLVTKIGVAALNRLALGVVVVDEKGRVAFTNTSAAAMLAEGDGLVLSSTQICRTSATDETKRLMDAVRQAASPLSDPACDTFALSVSRPSLRRPLSVFATPLDASGEGGAQKLVALFISDPETRPVPSEEQIARLYALTKSEAAIARALALGLRVEEAAATASVTVSTARTYLKQIFSKTETSRQSELLKLIIASPAVTPV